MALTYIQIYNRRTNDDHALLARVEVALVKFAIYCKAQAQNETWWPDALSDPAAKVQAMMWELCFDPAIADVEDSSTITDATIQSAVEAICLNY